MEKKTIHKPDDFGYFIADIFDRSESPAQKIHSPLLAVVPKQGRGSLHMVFVAPSSPWLLDLGSGSRRLGIATKGKVQIDSNHHDE